uniref:FH2 domain-containing protein n=1 Tax=Caenorhabditis tropicalis TaxID=1561998 RepID=A0A1I7UVP8_9PELO
MAFLSIPWFLHLTPEYRNHIIEQLQTGKSNLDSIELQKEYERIKVSEEQLKMIESSECWLQNMIIDLTIVSALLRESLQFCFRYVGLEKDNWEFLAVLSAVSQSTNPMIERTANSTQDSPNPSKRGRQRIRHSKEVKKAISSLFLQKNGKVTYEDKLQFAEKFKELTMTQIENLITVEKKKEKISLLEKERQRRAAEAASTAQQEALIRLFGPFCGVVRHPPT